MADYSKSQYEFLYLQKEKSKAEQILIKAHANMFNVYSKYIDQESSRLFQLTLPILKKLKELFPTVKFVMIPVTATTGGDIAPYFDIKIDTNWYFFGITHKQAIFPLSHYLQCFPGEFKNTIENLVESYCNKLIVDKLPPNFHLHTYLKQKNLITLEENV